MDDNVKITQDNRTNVFAFEGETMSKKIKISIIAILLSIIASTSIIFIKNYNKIEKVNERQHVVLSKKFYIPIKENTDIIYFNNDEGKEFSPVCKATLRINEDEYKEFILNIQKTGYISASVEQCKSHFVANEDWKSVGIENIEEVYRYNTSEPRGSDGNKRVHIYIFITDSLNGYREAYLINYGGKGI